MEGHALTSVIDSIETMEMSTPGMPPEVGGTKAQLTRSTPEVCVVGSPAKVPLTSPLEERLQLCCGLQGVLVCRACCHQAIFVLMLRWGVLIVDVPEFFVSATV
eukprot:4251391-Amphidinium_carterae.2